MNFKEYRMEQLQKRIQVKQNELQTLQNELEEISKEDSSWIDLEADLRDIEDFPEYNTNGFPYITVTIMRASNAADRITVKDLISCKKEDISHGRCVGKKRMEHLVSWMDKYHLKFADEADTI